VPALPEGLVEGRVEDLVEAGVDVGEEVFFGPFEAEGVEPGRYGRGRVLAGRLYDVKNRGWTHQRWYAKHSLTL